MVNQKGREETGSTYVDKNGKACQEKFNLIMNQCAEDEFKHLYESGRNELGSDIEKEAYECYRLMHDWETTDGARRDAERRKRELMEKAGQNVQALALGQVIHALDRKKEQQQHDDEDGGGEENENGGEEGEEDGEGEEEEEEEEEEGVKRPLRNKGKLEFRPRNCAGRLALQQNVARRREIEGLIRMQEKEKEERNRQRVERWIEYQALIKQVAADNVEDKNRRDREIEVREDEIRLRQMELREMRESRNAEMEIRREELAVHKQEAENMRRLVEHLSAKKYHNE
jgi:hypothetical protein